MLIKMTGTMPEREQVLHDLDMPRLLARMLPDLTEEQACLFLQKYLCRDSAEIGERSQLLEEFAEKSDENELMEFSLDLRSLSEERRKEEQALDRVHQLLYRGRRLEIYIRCIDRIAEIGSRGFRSERMNELTEQAKAIQTSEVYRAIRRSLDEYHDKAVFPKSAVIGLNAQSDGRPLEMGLLRFEEKAEPMVPAAGTEHSDKEANSLFAGMVYNRTIYGTHFDEYLSTALEKQWKNRITRLLDMFRKTPEPREEILDGLADELLFYARGLAMIRVFKEQGYPVCRPAAVESDTARMQAVGMIYPELGLKSKEVQPNPVTLQDGGSVIVTGANHSGKTSYLKMISQNLLFAQLGYYAVADSFRFVPADRLFTLFSSGEDSDMTASRMGVEVRILAEILETAGSRDLVLINEPLTSTNPVEAISICADLVTGFLEKNVTCMMVTHLYDIYFLLRSRLSEELDANLTSMVAEAESTAEGMEYFYHFEYKDPLGNSYAKETARAFGITLEDLIADPDLRRQAEDYCVSEDKNRLYRKEDSDELSD